MASSKSRSILTSDEWKEMPKDVVKAIINSIELTDMREIEIFRAVVSWCNYQHAKPSSAKKKRKLSESQEKEKEKEENEGEEIEQDPDDIRDLLDCINFRLINIKDIESEVEPSGLLSDTKLKEIYKFHAIHTTVEFHQFANKLRKGKAVYSPLFNYQQQFFWKVRIAPDEVGETFGVFLRIENVVDKTLLPWAIPSEGLKTFIFMGK